MNFDEGYEMRTLLGLPDTYEVFGFSGITSEDKTAFVTKHLPVAKKVGAAFSLNPLAILSQAVMESGWGTSYMAKNNFNYFGITAFGQTNQYWLGEKYTSKTSGLVFRKYPNIEAGFSDYARLITSKYKQAAAVSNKIEDYAYQISISPYLSEAVGDNRELYRKGLIASAKQLVAIITGKPLPTATTTKSNQPVTKSQQLPLPPVPPAAELPKENKSGKGAAVITLSAIGLLALAFTSNNQNKSK